MQQYLDCAKPSRGSGIVKVGSTVEQPSPLKSGTLLLSSATYSEHKGTYIVETIDTASSDVLGDHAVRDREHDPNASFFGSERTANQR